MNKTRLFPAAEWVCDQCGRFNFTSLIGAEVPKEVAEQMRSELQEEFGLEQVSGEFLIQPTLVKCQYCFTEFEAAFDEV